MLTQAMFLLYFGFLYTPTSAAASKFLIWQDISASEAVECMELREESG